MPPVDFAEDSEGESPVLSLESAQPPVPIEQPKPSRPKPRPVKRKQPADIIPDSQALPDRSASYSADSFADIYTGPSSIADRAKTRTRGLGKHTQPVEDTIVLTSDDGKFDELFSSQPKKGKNAKTLKAPVRARQLSPYADSVYGIDAPPSTFLDTPLDSAFAIPLSNPYSIPPTPPVQNTQDDDLPPITILLQDNSTASDKQSSSFQPTPFFASSSSSVPFPSAINDSGVADVSTSSSYTKKLHAKESQLFNGDAEEAPSGSKKSKNAKAKKKVAFTDGKKKTKKDKNTFESTELIDDNDELNSIPMDTPLDAETLSVPVTKQASRTVTSSKPASGSSGLSSVPPSDAEEELKVQRVVRKRKVTVDSDEEDFAPTKRTKKAAVKKGKGKKVLSSEDEGDNSPPPSPKAKKKAVSKPKPKPKGAKADKVKLLEKEESVGPSAPNPPRLTPPQSAPVRPTSSEPQSVVPITPIPRSRSILPRRTSTPMSELIRKVNSQPGSVFRSSPAADSGGTTLAYSSYAKTSRSMLSRIAPLHPNRKPPPAPLPPPPPRKKTKKELEREEQWEEELVESAGGIEQWICLTDDERKEMRRAKREMEMAGWED